VTLLRSHRQRKQFGATALEKSLPYCQSAVRRDEAAKAAGLSTCRQPNNSHSLTNTLTTGDVGRMIACRPQEVASNCEFWIKGHRRGRDGLSLVHLLGKGQRSRQMKLSDCIIPVCFCATAKPGNSTGVVAEHQCGDPCGVQPPKCKDVSGREAFCFADIKYALLKMTKQLLTVGDHTPGVGKIAIQCQSAFALCKAGLYSLG
jgi:hypothetical protein